VTELNSLFDFSNLSSQVALLKIASIRLNSLALEGAGIALLPSFLCESEIKTGKLIPILQEWTSEIAPMHFVYPAQKYVPPAIKAFIEMSTVVLRSRFKFVSN
jgi:DNA-binding transcriptional LysR family regulator